MLAFTGRVLGVKLRRRYGNLREAAIGYKNIGLRADRVWCQFTRKILDDNDNCGKLRDVTGGKCGLREA